jgi:hypothetical protein
MSGRRAVVMSPNPLSSAKNLSMSREFKGSPYAFLS